MCVATSCIHYEMISRRLTLGTVAKNESHYEKLLKDRIARKNPLVIRTMCYCERQVNGIESYCERHVNAIENYCNEMLLNVIFMEEPLRRVD